MKRKAGSSIFSAVSNNPESRDDEKDKLELESTMSYLQDKLKVSLENAELFVVLEIVQAPSVGEITRAGFVNGWKELS